MVFLSEAKPPDPTKTRSGVDRLLATGAALLALTVTIICAEQHSLRVATRFSFGTEQGGCRIVRDDEPLLSSLTKRQQDHVINCQALWPA